MAEHRERTKSQRLLVPAVGLLGAYHLALGAIMALSPGRFFESIAGYGVRNDHYIRDVSSFYLALGVVLLLALVRRSWRVPLLAFAAAQYALHSINHAIDVGDADPGYVGPVNLISLALLTAVIVVLLRSARRAER